MVMSQASSGNVLGVGRDTRGSRLVFVTCGTDHHPFDRLIDWVDDAIERLSVSASSDGVVGSGGEVELVVQYGGSRPPRSGRGVEFMSGEEIAETMGRASAVICSAGPGAVMDSRNAGRRPIVVARNASEAVDGHQLAFAAHLGRVGMAVSVSTADELFEAIRRDLDEPESSVVPVEERYRVGLGVAKIGDMIDRLVWGQ